MQRYVHWIGAGVGVLIGAVEVTALSAAGVRMTITGRDVAIPVAVVFELSFGVVGFLVGRLVQTRSALRADAATIRSQMADLERSRAVALHHERMAAIGRLAAGIAHEVRNPLGVIRASASMVHDAVVSDPDAQRACRFIQEETDRLDGFIATLLTFAKPAHVRFRPCQAGDVVSRAVELSAEAARSAGVAVHRDVRDASSFAADPVLVTQVLLGLIVNAIEAVGRGGRVIVTAESEPGGVAISVADDGPGVDRRAVTHLFEPFFTTKLTGTGLGLSVASEVVAAHGGTLQHLDGHGLGPDGRGACFRLVLPSEPRAAVSA